MKASHSKENNNKIKTRLCTYETKNHTSQNGSKHQKLWNFRLTKEIIIGG